MNLPQNFVPAMLMTLFAGLTTAIGGAIAFMVKKDNLKALSVGLGFSAGVMIFLSFTDIIPEAGEMLSVNFPNTHEWLVFFGFIAGIVVAILIDYFLPDHVDPDELADPEAPCTHQHKIKRAGLLTGNRYMCSQFSGRNGNIFDYNAKFDSWNFCRTCDCNP